MWAIIGRTSNDQRKAIKCERESVREGEFGWKRRLAQKVSNPCYETFTNDQKVNTKESMKTYSNMFINLLLFFFFLFIFFLASRFSLLVPFFSSSSSSLFCCFLFGFIASNYRDYHKKTRKCTKLWEMVEKGRRQWRKQKVFVFTCVYVCFRFCACARARLCVFVQVDKISISTIADVFQMNCVLLAFWWFNCLRQTGAICRICLFLFVA